jgi:hypothetical protein|nr:MAG TPA: hypothetical protein [Caudoviricetes sp.]
MNDDNTVQLEAAVLSFKKMRLGTFEMDYPFTDGQDVFILESDGMIVPVKWSATPYQCMMHHHGVVFLDVEAALAARDKRLLMVSINEFRTLRNDGWEPSFGGSSLKDAEPKWCIGFLDGDLFDRMDVTNCSFPMFGYFKNRDDVRMAIMLFGKEIKRLFCGEF